jgi:hypothetical protein
MNATLKQKMIAIAQNQYGNIAPCANRTMDECFTIENGELYFWFNSSDNSTHIVHESKI